MTDMILRLFLGSFLMAHGLLHWRFDISRSWLLNGIRLLDSQPIHTFAVLLSLLATIGFIAAGPGVMGFPLIQEWWRTLTIASACVSLVLLVLAWHPWLTLGILIDVAILISLQSGRFSPESILNI